MQQSRKKSEISSTDISPDEYKTPSDLNVPATSTSLECATGKCPPQNHSLPPLCTNSAIVLNPAQLTVLAALFDTFLPKLCDADAEHILKTYPSEEDEAAQKEEFLKKFHGAMALPTFLVEVFYNDNIISPTTRSELAMILSTMSTSVGMLLLAGCWSPFPDLTPKEREGALIWMAESLLWQKRMIFNALRGLIMLYCGVRVEEVRRDEEVRTDADDEKSNHIAVCSTTKQQQSLPQTPQQKLWNPMWSYIKYAGPCEATLKRYHAIKHKLWTLPPLSADLSQFVLQSPMMAPEESLPALDVDVCVVGSGAGGGVVALHLAQQGYKVLVLESGPYASPHDVNLYEGETLQQHYLHGGGLTTTNKAISILSGHTFGGGTAINWACCLPPPARVREEWANDYGLNFVNTPGFVQCLERIEDVMQIHDPNEHHNIPNTLLLNGSRTAGYAVKNCLQNVSKVEEMGSDEYNSCGLICKTQQKQGTNVSFLPLAINNYNCQVLTQCKVTRVLFDDEEDDIATTTRTTPRCCGLFDCDVETFENAQRTYQPSEYSTMKELNLNDRFNTEYVEHLKQSSQQEYIAGNISQRQVHTSNLPKVHLEATKRTAVGVECILTTNNGGSGGSSGGKGFDQRHYHHQQQQKHIKLRIKAKIVVLSAGALHTPNIISKSIRSNEKNPHIGQNLRLHPAQGVGAIYPHVVSPWKGLAMTACCEEQKNQTSSGYGAIVECPSAQIGLLCAGLGWRGGAMAKEVILNFNNVCAFLVLNRDFTSKGSVQRDVLDERPVVQYDFTAADRNRMLEGVLTAIQIHVQAGATLILPPYQQIAPFRPSAVLGLNDPALKEWLGVIKQHGLHEHTTPLFSAHQMGTCRMAQDPNKGATNVNGELHSVNNLYVADTSLFPTASGVNPMWTVMALAQYVALNITERLKQMAHVAAVVASSSTAAVNNNKDKQL